MLPRREPHRVLVEVGAGGSGFEEDGLAVAGEGGAAEAEDGVARGTSGTGRATATALTRTGARVGVAVLDLARGSAARRCSSRPNADEASEEFRITAERHAGFAGGSFGQETGIFDCGFDSNAPVNVEVRAYDWDTDTWTDPVPVRICRGVL